MAWVAVWAAWAAWVVWDSRSCWIKCLSTWSEAGETLGAMGWLLWVLYGYTQQNHNENLRKLDFSMGELKNCVFFNDKTIWFSPIGKAVQKMIYSWWVLRIYGELSMVNFRRVWHRRIKAVSLGLRTSSANWERLSLNQPVWRGSLWRKTLLSSAMHSDFFFGGLND